MKKILCAILLLMLILSVASAEETPVSNTVIPSVLTRKIKTEKITGNNPFIPGESPTTGLPHANEKYVPILCQIDNNLGALPQWGLIAADIMYELPISGVGWTRLTALFSDQYPEEAGPVRSARVMHADLREEWDALIVHFGEQTVDGSNFRQAIRDYGVTKKGLEIDGIGNKYSDYFQRVRYHTAPHNVTAYIDKLKELMVASGYIFAPRPFKFTDAMDYAGPSAVKININHKKNESTSSTFYYDTNSGSYLRYTIKGIYSDYRNPDATLAYSNVIVQRTKLAFNGRSQNPILPNVVGSGAADIFIGGKYIEGAWARSEASARTVFFDQQGKEIELQRGKTWIIICDENSVVDFDDRLDADTAAFYALMGRLPENKPLQSGDRGDDVVRMKRRLYELGYYRTNKFKRDFDDATAEVVKRFETDRGLPADGIADSVMLMVLYAEPGSVSLPEGALAAAQPGGDFVVTDGGDISAQATPVPTSTPLPTNPPDEDLSLVPGALVPTSAPEPEGEPTPAPTAELAPEETPEATKKPEEETVPEEDMTPNASLKEQLAAIVNTSSNGDLNLRESASPNGKIVTKIPDKAQVQVLEQGTEWTNIRFQGQDGHVMSSFLEFFTAEAPLQTGELRPLTIMDSGEDVLKLKQRFYELGYFKGNTFNDVFQDSTAATVRRFEKRNGLPEDGIADVDMLTLLYSIDAKAP